MQTTLKTPILMRASPSHRRTRTWAACRATRPHRHTGFCQGARGGSHHAEGKEPRHCAGTGLDHGVGRLSSLWGRYKHLRKEACKDCDVMRSTQKRWTI